MTGMNVLWSPCSLTAGSLTLVSEKEYEVLADNVRFTHRGERHFCAAAGADGGGPGGMAVSTITRANGETETIPSKLVTLLNKGDRVSITTAGGGGHGNPSERERAEVARDVGNGKVSPEAACELYGATVLGT